MARTYGVVWDPVGVAVGVAVGDRVGDAVADSDDVVGVGVGDGDDADDGHRSPGGHAGGERPAVTAVLGGPAAPGA
jgi:hypothetical protein